jgi:hypothetical protein
VAAGAAGLGREGRRVGLVQRASSRDRRGQPLQLFPQLRRVRGSRPGRGVRRVRRVRRVRAARRQTDAARVGAGPHRRGQQRPGVTRVIVRVVTRERARGGQRPGEVTGGKTVADLQPGQRERVLGFGVQSGGQRAQLADRVRSGVQVAAGHLDQGTDQQRVGASQRRLIQAEDLVQDLQRLIPASRGGQ